MKYRHLKPTKDAVSMFAKLYNVDLKVAEDYLTTQMQETQDSKQHFNGKHTVARQICRSRAVNGVCKTCRRHGRM